MKMKMYQNIYIYISQQMNRSLVFRKIERLKIVLTIFLLFPKQTEFFFVPKNKLKVQMEYSKV